MKQKPTTPKNHVVSAEQLKIAGASHFKQHCRNTDSHRHPPCDPDNERERSVLRLFRIDGNTWGSELLNDCCIIAE